MLSYRNRTLAQQSPRMAAEEAADTEGGEGTCSSLGGKGSCWCDGERLSPSARLPPTSLPGCVALPKAASLA